MEVKRLFWRRKIVNEVQVLQPLGISPENKLFCNCLQNQVVSREAWGEKQEKHSLHTLEPCLDE